MSSPGKNYYLIITREIFWDEIQPLINKIESNGTIVFALKLEEINNTYLGRDIQEKIRNCI